MIKQDEGINCPNCRSNRCVAAVNTGERIGLISGALFGTAFVVWTVLSPASAGTAGRVLASPSVASKVGKIGLMIGDIFCGAQAGQALGKYYDQTAEGEISCMECGASFKFVV